MRLWRKLVINIEVLFKANIPSILSQFLDDFKKGEVVSGNNSIIIDEYAKLNQNGLNFLYI